MSNAFDEPGRARALRKLRLCCILPALAALSSCYSVPLDKSVPRGEPAYTMLKPGSDAYQAGLSRLEPNDIVSVNVFQEPDLSVTETAIDASGNLALPLLGQVPATGVTANELARNIEALLGPRYLAKPRVTVTLITPSMRRVTVEGQVQQPGIFPITGPTTLVQAIALARGTTRTAKVDEVVVFRTIGGQRMAARFDLRNIRAARDPDPQLAPDDIVVVGFSEARGAWEDLLRTIPVANIFRPFN